MIVLKQYLVTAFIFVVSTVKAQGIDLNSIRKDLSQAVKSESVCEKNLDWLADNASSVSAKGYAAIYRMMMANHTSNPLRKMSHFKAGKKELEELISQNANHTELRFIRLVVQAHAPKILGYHHEIEKDKDFLVANLSKISDQKTHELLYKHLKGANLFTSEELKNMAK